MSKGLSRTLVLGHIYRAGIYEYISFAICSVCFSLLPRTEAVHPLPHSHVLTLQCSQFTNTLNKLVGAHLPILSGWTCWQCSSARSCLWLLSGCRLFILCIKPSAVFKKWERRCPPESGTVCVSQKTSIDIVTETYLPFPSFCSFFSSLLSSLLCQWRGVLQQQGLEGAGILLSFSPPFLSGLPPSLTEKFQGEFQEWSHEGKSFTLGFFRGSAGEMGEGTSFLDNPSILANVSDSILYTVITQRCILNYLILRALVFSRLPDVYFEVCVCI